MGNYQGLSVIQMQEMFQEMLDEMQKSCVSLQGTSLSSHKLEAEEILTKLG